MAKRAVESELASSTDAIRSAIFRRGRRACVDDVHIMVQGFGFVANARELGRVRAD